MTLSIRCQLAIGNALVHSSNQATCD